MDTDFNCCQILSCSRRGGGGGGGGRVFSEYITRETATLKVEEGYISKFEFLMILEENFFMQYLYSKHKIVSQM